MSIVMSAKNKTMFVTGALKKPKDDDPLLCAWIRCKDMVCSWLTNSLCKKIASSILYITTAVEVCNNLHKRFSRSNRLKFFQLRKVLSKHSQGNSSVINYFTELKSI